MRRRRREEGASAVEFALILIPFLTIVFGIIQYGFFFYASQSGASTAREAVRRLAVGDCPTAGELNTFVTNRLGGASLSLLEASRTYHKVDGTLIGSDASAAEVGGRVTVTVRFQSLDMNFPFIPVPNNAQVTRRVDARVEDKAASGSCA